ncbi:MAG: DUF86 domain-containing protein [Methanomicrobiales archaeon]|jgi:uncharacterized protein with HEPN domain|nr:DUF86 domain-containing protein [Methanomicrobiales archaeon]
MPHHHPKKYLYDIHESTRNILDFVSEKTFADYSSSLMLKSAVERQFETIGEALKQLIKRYPEYKSEITNPSRIIAFRNRLIHGYSSVSDEVAWGIIEKDLPILNTETMILLKKETQEPQNPIPTR